MKLTTILVIAVAVIFSVVIVVSGFVLVRQLQYRLTVVNQTGLLAETIHVEVCGRDIKLENVPPCESRTRLFRITRDSGFNVTVQLADGTHLTETFGYVTTGPMAYGNNIHIEITPEKTIQGTQLR